jgi:NYN domain
MAPPQPASPDDSQTGNGMRRITSALFVDFDNVFLGLRRLGEDVAVAWGNDPGVWLRRLDHGEDADGPFVRRILVRNCYLNPSAFADYRAPFTRAGFRVIDCPSLTQQGKSAADVNLVLDVMDVLQGPLHYNEFFIMSADADFTPLAIRCREADRRVTIAAAGPAAAAYRAVADQVLIAEDLAGPVRDDSDGRPEDAVRVVAPPARKAATKAATKAVKKAANSLPTKAADPAPTAKKTPAKRPAKKSAAPASRGAAVAAVLEFVRGASGPVSGGAVAQAAQHADPDLPKTRWDGAGGFTEWVSTRVPEIGYARTRVGYAWDPARWGVEDIPLLRQVQQITDTPGLSRDQYAAVLTAIAEDVGAQPFTLAGTGKRVRDACQAAGVAVGRGNIDAVLKGVLYAGFTFEGRPDVYVIAEHWADNVIGLCRGARMELSEGDEKEIRGWVGGGLA